MKLRYYLRGLGIGIIFSALICSFGRTNAQEPMSDSEIIARAKELGMVEGTVLSLQQEVNAEYTAQLNENGELVLETTPVIEETETLSVESEESIEPETVETEIAETEVTETVTEDENQETEEESEAIADENNNQESEAEETTVTEEEAVQPEITEPEAVPETNTENQVPSGVIVQITVKSGSGSYTVAKSCESAGVVLDARDFDDYLCANGYANRICVGTFDIPSGSDYETIAKIITRSK